jgi:hypothetical protein
MKTTKTARINRPQGYRPVLTSSDAKTVKGESRGYRTGICYLAPANESGVLNTCTYASAECKQACLFTAGRGAFPKIRQQRIAKTLFLHSDRALFLDSLRADIRSLVAYCAKRNMTPAIRLNGTSDMSWMALQMSAEFPEVQFYDYTKLPKAWIRQRANYHLTFSYSGLNLGESLAALAHGVNVAVVFDTRKGQDLPVSWNGYPVIDGDLHDLRFLDSKGVVVGLRAKGRAKKTESAFIVKTNGTAAIGGKPQFVTYTA